MEKVREHTNEMRLKFIGLHKSGNDYKKCLKISPITAIIKNFKTTGTVMNSPETGWKIILPPLTVKQRAKEPNSPRITGGKLVASWLPRTTIRLHCYANNQFGRFVSMLESFYGPLI